MDLFDKCYNYQDAKMLQQAGVYPFFRAIQNAAGPRVLTEGKERVMIGSNNYLGLTHDARVRRAAIAAIEQYGTGCTGSRLLNGTLEIHREIEQRLARFMRREAAAVFTTGFQTNLGVISALADRNDYVIIDAASHASIRDGCRLSYATILKFRHNDMDDLRRCLERVPSGRGVLIVVDGVYSMEGDLANLPELVALKRRYGARLLIDDAHALGVLGDGGRGTPEHFGLEEEVDLITATFSKSLASVGGFVVGDAKVVRYIQHTARPFLFSASLPPAAIGAAMQALEIVEREPERRQRLRARADQLRAGLRGLGFDTGDSQTPIIPIIIGSEMTMGFFWKGLLDAGVYTNAVIAPAVPPHRALIRMSCTAEHTPAQIDQALTAIGRVGRAQGLIT